MRLCLRSIGNWRTFHTHGRDCGSLLDAVTRLLTELIDDGATDSATLRLRLVQHSLMGDVKLDVEPLVAKQEYDHALAIAHELAERNPNGAPHAQDLSLAIKRIADWHERRGDFDKAEMMYKEALHIQNGVLNTSPKGYWISP